MTVATQVRPSKHARILFGEIVAKVNSKKHSDGRPRDEMDLEEALELSQDRVSRGWRDEAAFGELLEENWVAPSESGGVKVLIF